MGDPKDPHRDLAGVLHDVSNALTVLLGWVGEAKRPDASPEATAYALAIVEQRARIARDLARQAIGAPRIDEQRSIGEIVGEVLAALRIEAARAGTGLVVHGVELGPRVAGAEDVAQVLTNLVLNAIAYAPAASLVEVELRSDDDDCVVVVTDHGPGVPAEKRESIFEGESLRPGGTGVGLRHARALARSWQGDVSLLPALDGAGARFAMTWPRVDAVPRAPVSVRRATELAGMRILVVEDDAAVTQLLETALEARGAAVTIAGSTSEVDAALDGGAPYAAALLDLSPIAADVPGTLARLRATSPGIDLILITGSADRLPESIAAEGMKCVQKPFEVGESRSLRFSSARVASVDFASVSAGLR